MKGKDTAKMAMTYVILVGLIAFALVYFLGYKGYLNKADALRASNATLKERVNELAVFYEQVEENKKGIIEKTDAINGIIDTYPSNVKAEDVIMLAYKAFNDTKKLQYEGINVNEPSVIYSIPLSTVKAANIETYQSPLVFVENSSAYINKSDYEDMKTFVKTVLAENDKKTVKNITYKLLDTENILEGTIEVSAYYVLGTNKEYVPVKIPDYKSGVTDLFGLKSDEEWAEEQKKNEENK